MTGPTTAAGRALLDALWNDEPSYLTYPDYGECKTAIAAIEAEAAAAARTALLDELEAAIWPFDVTPVTGDVRRAAVLAEIDRRRTP